MAITTALALVLHLVAHSSRVGSTLLIGVLITCYVAGSGPGYLAAVLSFFVLYAEQPTMPMAIDFGSLVRALGGFCSA